MKTIIAVAILVGFVPLANTQNTVATATMSPTETLNAIVSENEEMLKRQQALLQDLDELEQDASQLRIFTRRS